jgi:hypothetical protein
VADAFPRRPQIYYLNQLTLKVRNERFLVSYWGFGLQARDHWLFRTNFQPEINIKH